MNKQSANDFHAYLAANEYIQQRVSEFVQWLTEECGGGCDLGYAVERWGADEVEAALAKGVIERAGPDRSDVALHWSLPEKLKRLEITTPPDWNEYDAYLLSGGQLEYEEWTNRSEAQKETPDQAIEG